MHTLVVTSYLVDDVRISTELLDVFNELPCSEFSMVINFCVADNCSVNVSDLIKKFSRVNIFVWMSTNCSLSIALNTSKLLAKKIFFPDIISFCEDDHVPSVEGLQCLSEIVPAASGKLTNNNFRAGMFTICDTHIGSELSFWKKLNAFNLYVPEADSSQLRLGACNNCFRSGLVNFWDNIAGEYAEDGYPISNYQTMQHGVACYNKGYGPVYVSSDTIYLIKHYDDDGFGRGSKDTSDLKLWDKEFSAFDQRAIFRKD